MIGMAWILNRYYLLKTINNIMNIMISHICLNWSAINLVGPYVEIYHAIFHFLLGLWPIFHNDTTAQIFSNKNGQNSHQNSYVKELNAVNDMLRDLFQMFQNLPGMFFSLQKKVVGSVEHHKNSNLSLLSLVVSSMSVF